MIGQFLSKPESESLTGAAAEIRRRIEKRFETAAENRAENPHENHSEKKTDTPDARLAALMKFSKTAPVSPATPLAATAYSQPTSGTGSVANAYRKQNMEIVIPKGWATVFPSQANIAASCPHCINYDSASHFCTLFGEAIPKRESDANPCKGVKFNRKRGGLASLQGASLHRM
ncbi:MAG: hypothetical protein IAF08_15320 [Rhizobacter sp.]|nr:hypothetical protein [Chlorobiales bacterium]